MKKYMYDEPVFPYAQPDYFTPRRQPDYAIGKWLKAVATGGASLIVDNAREKKAAEAAAKAAQEAARVEAEKAAVRQKSLEAQRKNLETQQAIIKQYEQITIPAGNSNGTAAAAPKSSMVPVLIALAVVVGLVFILKKKK